MQILVSALTAVDRRTNLLRRGRGFHPDAPARGATLEGERTHLPAFSFLAYLPRQKKRKPFMALAPVIAIARAESDRYGLPPKVKPSSVTVTRSFLPL